MHLEVYLLNLINKSFFKTVLFFNCTCRKDSCNMDYLPSVQLSKKRISDSRNSVILRKISIG